MQFKVFEKNIDVNGQTVFAIVDGFKRFKSMAAKYLLAENIGTSHPVDFVTLDLNAWYSQESWLKAFENIAKEVGSMTLFEIGQAIPRNAQFPEWVKDIDSAVKSIDIAYHMNHRKQGQVMFNTANGKMLEGIGHYGYDRVSDKNLILSVCSNPYPCDFDRGIITAMAKKFELRAKVVHDDSKSCRKNNADSCTYIITW